MNIIIFILSDMLQIYGCRQDYKLDDILESCNGGSKGNLGRKGSFSNL